MGRNELQSQLTYLLVFLFSFFPPLTVNSEDETLIDMFHHFLTL